MKTKKKTSLFDVCNTLIMLAVLFLAAYPLYYTVIASLSDPNAVASGEVVWAPVNVTMDAYKQVLAYKPIWTGYVNSLYYTVMGTLFNLFLTIPAAYALSKKYLPFRSGVMTVFFITMYFGGGLVPTYLLVKGMGLLNSRTVMVIMGGLSVYNLIVSRVYFSTSISDTLYEAADIDGAGGVQEILLHSAPAGEAYHSRHGPVLRCGTLERVFRCPDLHFRQGPGAAAAGAAEGIDSEPERAE